MSTNIIDRRKNQRGKSTPNRRRFLKRIEDQIKKALPDVIDNNSIEDIGKGKKGIKIPVKGIKEPDFQYDNTTGNKKFVHPGNKKFTEGDKVRKPENGGKGANGRKGSTDPTITEDDFSVTISRDEFLEYFFNDLELPNQIKKSLARNVEWKQKRAGHTTEGIPARLNIIHSYKNSLARRITMQVYYDNEIEELEKKLKEDPDNQLIIEEIEEMKHQKEVIPYMDDIDLRYNNYKKEAIPSTSAVMFCIMDVSGSMGFDEKDIAKRFFILLYMFLTKQYENVEIVYIRHHTQAKEVNEKEFFESRESGGTEVYPALELMNNIIDERYSSGWNVYASQISDGDVWGKADADKCYTHLKSNVLKKLQYMVYIETLRDAKGDLWANYSMLEENSSNFAIGQINAVSEIWEVFRKFFKKKEI